MYICMYVCISVCMYVRMYICMYEGMLVGMFLTLSILNIANCPRLEFDRESLVMWVTLCAKFSFQNISKLLK